MTTDLRIQATVSADGRQASAELKRLAGDVGLAKQQMIESQAASRAAAAALKAHAAEANADADEVTRLRDALIAARASEAETTRTYALSAAAMNRASSAANALGESNGRLGASSTNLGRQVADISVGVNSGTDALTILAQQGPQVADAMAGMGGVLGRVGTFLSGPFGAAILGGTIALAGLVVASQEVNEEEVKAEAQKALLKTAIDRVIEAVQSEAQAQEEFDALLKRTAKTQDEEIIRQGRLATERLKAAEATRAQTRALLEQEKVKLAGDLARSSDPQFASEFGNAALPAIIQRTGRINDINQELRDLDARSAEDQARVRGADALIGLQRATNLTDAAAAATSRYKAEEARLVAARTAGKISQDAYIAALVTAKNTLEATTAKSADGKKAAKDLAAENLALARAYNPLLAAQQDYQKNLADISAAEARGIVSATAAAALRIDAAPAIVANDARAGRQAALGLTASGAPRIATADLPLIGIDEDAVAEMGALLAGSIADVAAEAGNDLARGFADTMGNLSLVIGGQIGRSIQQSLQRAGGIADLLNQSGDGRGDVFFREFASVGREMFRPVVKGLDDVFGGDGKFVKSLGQAFGGAAVGGGVADVAGALGVNLSRAGSQIGGAIGGLKGVGTALDGVLKGLGQFAPLIGGVLGGVIGKLVAPKNPFADVALSTTAAGVSGSVFNQRGDGSAARGDTLASAVQDQLSRLAGALGADIRPGQNLGAIGFSGEQFFFNRTGGDFKAAGNERFGSAEEAVGAAVANALSTGALATSPRVQAALQRYAGNVNTAVAEALKIRDLEQLLEAQGNPFTKAFRDFEQQARARVDVAREYGFDLIEIEKLNAEQRAALVRDTLQTAAGSARALLDEFRFGDRAGGSVRDQLGALGGERDRLAGLVRGGDGGQLDALTEVVRQIDDLQREAFGSTGEAASGRAASAALLQELVDATEARVRAAADAARAAQAEQTAALKSADATLEDIFQNSRQQLAALNAIAAGLRPGGGGSYDFGQAAEFGR